jgi:hypothetical protein
MATVYFNPNRAGKNGAAVLVAATIALSLGATETLAQGTTGVSISGEKFMINGVPTFAGRALEGRLPNSRMVQATFNDANPATIGMWRYPNGSPYSASRQTNEFVAALPTYRAYGLLAVTLNFQGGNPVEGHTGTQPWDNTAFNPDGSLKSDYLTRMDEAIRGLDAHGMIAILGYFYFGQDERLTDETAVRNAVSNATKWVLDRGYTNVLIEIDNEADNPGYVHPILRPGRVGELIRAVQTQSADYGRRLNVSVSFTGGQIPPADVMQAEDFVLLHGNGQTGNGITSMVNAVRSAGLNKAIVFNEDSTSTANFQAATNARASWGYFDAGLNNYVDGFQSPPTNWSVNTATKKNFFTLLRTLVGSTAGRTKVPTVSVAASPATINDGADSTFTISAASVNASQPTNVHYSMSGTAHLGSDYTLSGLPGQVVIPTGSASAGVILHAVGRTGAQGDVTATMTLTSGSNYRLPRRKKATITIRRVP